MGYYTRAATQAKTMNYPLAFRRGGGSSLGLKGKTPDTRGFNPWVVHGVPKWWGPSCLQAFFQTNGWEVQEKSMSPPRTQKQGWLVNLKPAEQAKEAEMSVFDCGDHIIKARKLQKLKPDVESKSIRMEGRWARPKEEDIARQVVNEATKATEARANSAGTVTNGDEQTMEPSARRQKIATPTKGPGDTEIWDLSGEGDCGMRAMAAAQAARKGRKPEDIEARIDTISNAMRVTTYQALKKYQGWKSGWCIQPDENPKTLGGEVPTSAEQWHEAVKARKNMWLDWRQLMALKEDLKSTIVVWEWSGAKANARKSSRCY